MENIETTITTITRFNEDYYLLSVKNLWQEKILPGQFAEITVKEVFLRKPFSVFDVTDKEVSFLIKIAGKGSRSLSSYLSGDKIYILMPLGNSFSLQNSKNPLLIGGGCGIAPMHFLSKHFSQKGIRPTLLWGEKTKSNIAQPVSEKIETFCDTTYYTEDGSFGLKGLVTSHLKEMTDYDLVFACGPNPMLKAIHQTSELPSEFSLEAYMACGIGACMGCVIHLKDKTMKRVCKDGPIFKGDLLW